MSFQSPLRLAVLAIAVGFLNLSPAFALDQKGYEAGEFKAAQASGKPVVVHVTAPWCPTCKAQHDALNSLAKNPAFASVTVYQVDFDSQPQIWKSFNARSQSTLVAYAGVKETGRLAGETAVKALEALVQSTLEK